MIKKICVTTGSRADYGLLCPILKVILKSKKLKLILIVTGTHLSKKHGYTINEIKKDGFKINAKFNMIPKNDTNYCMATSLGYGIMKFAKLLKKFKPDINLVLGDRDEMLASALAASHMNIINAHLMGGDKSGGIDEYNRHAITKLSNIHFTSTEQSKERIIKMGENPKYVIHTGTPVVDEILQKKFTGKDDLEKKYSIKFTGNEILLVQHPVTTQSIQSKKQIRNTLKAISKIKKLTIAISPNSDAGNRAIFESLKRFSKRHPYLKVFNSIPRSDYLGFLKSCSVLVGNSSSGMTEAGFFNTPVVNIGIRQANRERGSKVIDVSYNSNSIYKAILTAINKKKSKNFEYPKIFGDGQASQRIVRCLEKNYPKNIIHKQIPINKG